MPVGHPDACDQQLAAEDPADRRALVDRQEHLNGKRILVEYRISALTAGSEGSESRIISVAAVVIGGDPQCAVTCFSPPSGGLMRGGWISALVVSGRSSRNGGRLTPVAITQTSRFTHLA